MSAIQTKTNEPTSALGSLALRGSYEPLRTSGAFDNRDTYPYTELTPAIGREYANVQLVDLLKAPNADALIRDLAILVAERGVVIFKEQELNVEQQKELGHKLGVLSGRPAESGLHIHPTARSSELPNDVSSIDSARSGDYKKARYAQSRLASQAWHTDITFEPVPSDFAILKIHTLPESGGDTLWASAYEAYDRLSPAYQKFLEGLTATHDGNVFHAVAEASGDKIFTDVRGHPLNDGGNYSAVHPVIRTNPITGWKGVFVNNVFTKRINELTKDESDEVLNYLGTIVTQNHDLQVRHKWSRNDLAIWSNVSTFHSATFDYGSDRRTGDRVVSIGEKPYFDKDSVSRRAALGLPAFM